MKETKEMSYFYYTMISDIGELNKLCKEQHYYWGISKNSWEDFYKIEVSSQNFDGRPSLHEEVQFIDDAFLRMLNFCRDIFEV